MRCWGPLKVLARRQFGRAPNQLARRVAFDERYEVNAAARTTNGFRPDDLCHSVIGAFHEQVRLQRSDRLGRGVLVKHDNQVNRAQRAQNASPGPLVLYRAAGSFEASNRLIAVDRYDKSIAFGGCALQYRNMTWMEQVTAAVREADPQTWFAPLFAPAHRLIQTHAGTLIRL